MNKTCLIVVTWSLCCLTSVFAEAGVGIDVDAYVNLAEGRVWQYRASQNGGAWTPKSITVLGKISGNGMLCWALLNAGITNYIDTVTTNGLYFVGLDGGSFGQLWYTSPGQPLLKPAFTVGMPYAYSWSYRDYPLTMVGTIQMDPVASVTVPYGTFTECWQVTNIGRLSTEADYTSTQQVIFARGVGMIRSFKNDHGNTETYELTGLTVQPRPTSVACFSYAQRYYCTCNSSWYYAFVYDYSAAVQESTTPGFINYDTYLTYYAQHPAAMTAHVGYMYDANAGRYTEAMATLNQTL